MPCMMFSFIALSFSGCVQEGTNLTNGVHIYYYSFCMALTYVHHTNMNMYVYVGIEFILMFYFIDISKL